MSAIAHQAFQEKFHGSVPRWQEKNWSPAKRPNRSSRSIHDAVIEHALIKTPHQTSANIGALAYVEVSQVYKLTSSVLGQRHPLFQCSLG